MEENPDRRLIPHFEGDHRSLKSDQRCYVRFINLTDKRVEITWINYGGEYVTYRILPRGSSIDVNTFKTHPWLAIDCRYADRLHINKNWVYYPKTTREFLAAMAPNRHIPDNYETRLRAYITLPIHSLRYLSLMCIRNFFGEKDVDRISELEIPRHLGEELRKVIMRRNRELSLRNQ